MGAAASRSSKSKSQWPAARIDPAQVALLREVCLELGLPVKENDADMVRYAVSVFNLFGRLALFTKLLTGPDGEFPRAADLEELARQLGVSGR